MIQKASPVIITNFYKIGINLRILPSSNFLFMADNIELTQEYEVFPTLADLDKADQELVKEAIEATKRSYAPYSEFFVGAALLLEDESIVHGANQENAAYPECSCAERVAFVKAGTMEYDAKIKKIAVVALKNKEQVPATPCGSCRQIMLEFELRQKEDIEIIMLYAPGKWIKAKNMKSLLPFSFKL